MQTYCIITINLALKTVQVPNKMTLEENSKLQTHVPKTGQYRRKFQN